ncbi:MAG TPA: MarR family winged helix-turn-helix transcriptional regulator [Usitatibacter sp.]|nr:MarR family winged helix-turn-helix transcriptional regulator [Usitatibacter sp.]
MSAARKPSPPQEAPVQRWREALSDERIAHLLKLAFRETSRALQDRLAPHGVQYGHWTLLRVLWKTDGLTQRQLAGEASVSEPSAFTALRRMEELGYVKRRKVPGNQKQVRLFLTAKGAALRGASVGAAEEVNRVALAGLAKADLEAARRVLVAIVENLGRAAAG